MAKPKAAPATQVLERIDPDEDFSDVDGDLGNEFALTGADPDKHYVFVHNDRDSIGTYKSHVLRYEPVYAQDDSVRPLADAGLEEGQTITVRDHVLMACPRALFEKRQRFERKRNAAERAGLFGQAMRDAVMRRGADGRWAAPRQVEG